MCFQPRNPAGTRYATMTRAQLAAEYEGRVGYDPFADDARTTEDDVRELLRQLDEMAEELAEEM